MKPGDSAALRWALIAVAAIAGVHLIAYLTLLGFQRAQGDTTLATVQVGSHDVGGLEREELSARVEEIADEHHAQPVIVEAESATVRATRRATGMLLDADATTDDAWERGRRWLWPALFDHLAARSGRSIQVEPEHRVDEDTLERWAERAAESLSREPRPASIGFIHAADPDEVEIHVVEPVEGWMVDPSELAQRVRTAAEGTSGPLEIEAPLETVPPEVDERDVEAVMERARTAVSGPVVLQNPGAGEDLVLTPADLAAVLVAELEPDAEDGPRLEIQADPSRLEDLLGPERIAALESGPENASFSVTDGQVVITGGTPGFQLDPDRTAERIADAAVRPTDRTAQLAGERTPPEFTREEAEALGIKERVSEFTTPHSCCPPRVQNIQLAADILRGQIIRPGGRFSLNQGIGPRTRSRGFVSNGYIEDGELRTAVGGGVSQIGTTFFNAAWFAGIRLIEFKPHSLYIDRYPMGREATLDWNVLDVVVENDSPYGILIHTSYTDTSITFEFWSTSWAEVQSETIGPYNRREGETRDGFDVTVKRHIHYPDGTSKDEEYFHRYRPQD